MVGIFMWIAMAQWCYRATANVYSCEVSVNIAERDGAINSS